jgi:hypothetical protein
MDNLKMILKALDKIELKEEKIRKKELERCAKIFARAMKPLRFYADEGNYKNGKVVEDKGLMARNIIDDIEQRI